jgi:carbamoyltransferase
VANLNKPWVLGISSSHNGAVCLLKGDEIVAAIQEERLTRIKRQQIYGSIPTLSINYCLQHAGITPRDLDLIVSCVAGQAGVPLQDVRLNPLLHAVHHGVPVVQLAHHMAHAVSAFALSGFRDSAILVVDGIGSPEEDFLPEERAILRDKVTNGYETISLYAAEGTTITPLEKHLVENAGWIEWDYLKMPRFRSLGGIFSTAAWQIFNDYHEAGKVMGLAPFGTPVFPVRDFFDIVDDRFKYHDIVPSHFAHTERWPNRKTEYENLASSCQVALEEALLYLVGRLRALYPGENLSYAGGVALNSIANERIIRESNFKNIYIVPAAEDSGCAIGAAYYGLWQLTGDNAGRRLRQDAVGRPYKTEEIEQAVARTPGVVTAVSSDVLSEAVDMLSSGKIIGWFQGRSELGPRALGQRSILCDPRSPDAKDLLNSRVKHREGFRPFAPVIPLEEVSRWFEMNGHDPESPFMLRICRFREDKISLVPGVVHIDGTGRLQTVTAEENGRFYQLVKRFDEKTGVPILLNTSFNVMDEPIVETPEDALWCFLSTNLDALILEDRLITKKPGLRSILDFYPRITCVRIAQSRLVDKGRIGSGSEGESYVSFVVTTPWGRNRQAASPNILPVLSLMDGKTNGWGLLEKLSALEVKPQDEQTMLRSMPRWGRASSGESMVDGIMTVPLLTEMLYRQRVSAYDESSLTRMLIRLRRQSAISFGEILTTN